MRKRYFILFGLLTFSLALNGCWDRRELESLAIVQALGLDLDPQSNQLVISTMVAIPSKLGVGVQGGGGGDGEGGVMVLSIKAPSIYEGFNLINTTLNREISMHQNQILIFGETLAKRGVRKWIDNLVRFREIRRTLLLFVCQGKADEILQFQPKLEQNPAEYIVDLVNLTDSTAMFPKVTLHDFMEKYESYAQTNSVPLLAKYTPPGQQPPEPQTPPSGGSGEGGGDKTKKVTDIRLIGTAVFRKDKYVGKLDLYESQALQLLTNQFKQANLTIKDPLKKDNIVAVRLIGGNTTQVKFLPRKGNQFMVRTKLEADLISIQSGVNYSFPTKQPLLTKVLEQAIQNRMRKVIAKAQQDFKSDIFGFGVKVRNSIPTTTAWEKYDWPKKFPDAKINVRVKVALRRVGVQFEPPTLR